jgi:hypothetical protein
MLAVWWLKWSAVGARCPERGALKLRKAGVDLIRWSVGIFFLSFLLAFFFSLGGPRRMIGARLLLSEGNFIRWINQMRRHVVNVVNVVNVVMCYGLMEAVGRAGVT